MRASSVCSSNSWQESEQFYFPKCQNIPLRINNTAVKVSFPLGLEQIWLKVSDSAARLAMCLLSDSHRRSAGMTKRLLPFHRWPNSAACSSLLRVRPSAAWSTTTVLPSRSRVALSVLPLSKKNPPPLLPCLPFCPLSPPPPNSQTPRDTSLAVSNKAHISLSVQFFFKKRNDIPLTHCF